MHLWHIQPLRDLLVFVTVFGVLYVGFLLRIVTVPLLLAMLLAYLFEPIIKWLTRAPRDRVFSRHGAAAFIILAATLLIAVPVVLGVSFGVLQAVDYTQEQVTNVQTLLRSVDNPADKVTEAKLPGPRWVWMRDKLMDLKAQAENLAMKRAEQAPLDANGQRAPPVMDELDASDPLGVTVYKLVKRGGTWVRDNAGLISREALQTGAGALQFALSVLTSMGFLIFSAFLTLFFFFFISVSYSRFLRFWKSLIPESRRWKAMDLLHKMDGVIAGFIRGRLLICGILALYYTLAFWLIGAPAPFIVGPIFGLLHLIPYAASLSLFIVPGLIWLEPSGVTWQSQWWWILGGPALVYFGAQILDDYVLSPIIQGKSTNLDTPTILFASMAGGILAGFYGLLIAIPVGACIKILLVDVVLPRFRAWSEGRASDPLPFGQGS